MSECIHGFEPGQCGTCGENSPGVGRATEWGEVQSFSLVYIPSHWPATFVHLNVQGDHWKLRDYQSPHRRPIELAQSGEASTRLVLDLAKLVRVHELSYPHSRTPTGVGVTDSRYWFDEIQKANHSHAIGIPSEASTMR